MEASESSLAHENGNSEHVRVVTSLITENGKAVPVGVIAPRIPVYSDKRGKAFIPFLDERAIDFIVAQIIELIEDGFDCIIMISGARRKGKSTLGIQIARKVSQSFSVDNIAFQLQDFSEILHKNPYADVKNGIMPQAFLDEAGVGLYSKEWYATWQRNLVKCLEVIGIKKQICYFILPHARKLTGDIRDEMASMWIDVDTKYKHERGYAELFTGHRDKFKQSIWWRPKFAFKFKPLEDQFWIDYEIKKRSFVDDMASTKKTDVVLTRVAEELATGKKPAEIAEALGISARTVFRYKVKLAASG